MRIKKNYFDVIPNVCVDQTKVVGRSGQITDQLSLDNVVADGGANASQEEVHCMDQLKNHPTINTRLHLYQIEIKECNTKLIESFQLGYLSSKCLDEIPEFVLYHGDEELTIKLIHISNSIKLSMSELDLIQKANQSIFVDMLKFDVEFDFRSSLYGGLIVILEKNDYYDDFQIDWKSLKHEKENFNAYRKKNLLNEDLLLRINATKEMLKNNQIKNQPNRIFSIVKIHYNMSPLTSYVRADVKNFKEHFEKDYSLETKDLNQPLIELKQVELSLNFILKTQSKKKKNNLAKYQEIFIGEHFLVLPYEKKYLFAFSLLPSIFHRIVSLLKANNLRILIENSIIQMLKIKTVCKNSTSDWKNSIKFNGEANAKQSENNTNIIPRLSIKDNVELNEYVFPNTYHILQSLTLKSANENFDLERCEILGDSFLKLIVTLGIYLQFKSIKEGDIVSLKSCYVSNENLIKSAQNKKLQDYINWIHFHPKINSILPNEKINQNDKRLKFSLKPKALADTVESLIGCYLIHLGQKGAIAFIKWLELSDWINFDFEILSLPKPLLTQNPPDRVSLIEYETFSKKINYKFNDIIYLYQAFSHPCNAKNIYTESYEKLELIGDAVIDMLITQYIFDDNEEHSSGQLTMLRQSLVNNKFLADLSVKHNFHTLMKYDNPDIFNQINTYVKLHETLKLEDILDEFAPKCLADIFESVAGAIYLDSNYSLEAVWKVYFPFMKPYLIKFKNNPPISPIVALKNYLKPHTIFNIDFIEENNEITAIVKGDNKEFRANSNIKNLAEYRAYKKAAIYFDKDRNFNFI